MLGTRAQRGDHGESVPRGRRAGEEGADPWGRAVSGVGRRGLSRLLRERGGETGLRLGRAELGQADACAGSAGRPSGGCWAGYRERERGEGTGPVWAAGKEMGRGEMMGWVVLGLVVGLGFLWVSSLFYFYFLVFFLLSNSNSNKAI